MREHFRQEAGIGLIEVLVAAGIMTGVILAMFGSMNFLARSGKSISQANEFDSVSSSITRLLANETICAQAFRTGTAIGDPITAGLAPVVMSIGFAPVNFTRIVMSGSILVENGNSLQTGIMIAGLSFSEKVQDLPDGPDASGTPRHRGVYRLFIEGRPNVHNGAVGVPQKYFRWNVMLYTDLATNLITGCTPDYTPGQACLDLGGTYSSAAIPACQDFRATSNLTAGGGTAPYSFTLRPIPAAGSARDFTGLIGIVPWTVAAGSTGQLKGTTGTIAHQTGANLNWAAGTHGHVINSGGGTITEAAGVIGSVTNSGNTVTAARGVYAYIRNTATINSGVGVLIDTIQATNKWSLYAMDATAPSFFAGSVGIGLAAPTQKLDVAGNVGLSGTLMAGANVQATSAVTAGAGMTAGTDISAGARLLAGTDVTAGASMTAGRDISAGARLLAGTDVIAGGDVNAGANMNAAAFFYTSDERLKEELRPLEGSLERILALEGVSFRWRKTRALDVGLAASRVEEVYPELVRTDPLTGYKSVKYGNLVAPLIEALRELARDGEARDRRITSLEGELAALRTEVRRLAAGGAQQ